MATAFDTGTINQPDAGSVGLAMVEKIRDDLVAHAAWDLVEEFTAAAGLCRWYVFKCLAAQSGLSVDFYAVICRTLGDGSLRVAIGEGYNSTTHVLTLYPPAGYGAAILPDSSGRGNLSYTLSTAVMSTGGSSNTGPFNVSWAPSGTSTKWWLIVYDDGFSVAFNGASNGYFHVGSYTPLCAVPLTVPIHLFGSSGAGIGCHTRNPAVAGVSGISGNALQNYCQISGTNAPGLGFIGSLLYNDALMGGQRSMAEQGLNVFTPFTASDIARDGWVLGKAKRMRVNSNTPPAATAFGDAYVMQSRLWVPYHPTDGRMWDTGVAA